MYSIYKLTSPTKKMYVGKTAKGVLGRFNRGEGYVMNKELFNDIKTYGWHSFSKEILAVCEDPREAKKLENQFISKFNTTNPEIGYNTHRERSFEKAKEKKYEYSEKDREDVVAFLCENILKLNGTSSEKTPKIFEQLFNIYQNKTMVYIEDELKKTKALLIDKELAEVEMSEKVKFIAHKIYKNQDFSLSSGDRDKLLHVVDTAIRESYENTFKVPTKFSL